MATLFQTWQRHKNYIKQNFSRTAALGKRPQIKGVVSEVRTMSPKKPNSATRHVAKVKLTTERFITGRIPGAGYRCSRHNRVLVHGGRANDLPGVGYTLIRGVFDFIAMISKKKRRSIYGTSRYEGITKYVRKKSRATSA